MIRDEEEEVVAHEPIFPPPFPLHSTQPSPFEPTGKRNWSKREEEALIASYIEHCTDQIIGTNQKGAALWRNVARSYEAARASHPLELHKRTVSMMESHWKRMCTDIMKWVGYFDEAKRNIRSGESEEDVLKNAHLLYRHQHNKNFAVEHAWKMLEAYPKWRSRVERYLLRKGKKVNVSSESDSSGKRVRLDDEEEITTPSGGGDVNFVSGGLPRLDGVKKAKAARSEGKKNASVGFLEVGLSLNDKLQLTAEAREKKLICRWRSGSLNGQRRRGRQISLK